MYLNSVAAVATDHQLVRSGMRARRSRAPSAKNDADFIDEYRVAAA